MSFSELLDSEAPQDSWAEAIRDIQARQIAMVSLLVARGVFTEEEFQRDRTHWARQLDEEHTRRNDERNQAAVELQRRATRQVYAELAQHTDFVRVDIFRATSPDLRGRTGVLIVRIISETFAGLSDKDRHSLFQQRIARLNRLLHASEDKLLPILLTQEEKVTSVASLQFDMMIETQGLTEIPPDGQSDP